MRVGIVSFSLGRYKAKLVNCVYFVWFSRSPSFLLLLICWKRNVYESSGRSVVHDGLTRLLETSRKKEIAVNLNDREHARMLHRESKDVKTSWGTKDIVVLKSRTVIYLFSVHYAPGALQIVSKSQTSTAGNAILTSTTWVNLMKVFAFHDESKMTT